MVQSDLSQPISGAAPRKFYGISEINTNRLVKISWQSLLARRAGKYQEIPLSSFADLPRGFPSAISSTRDLRLAYRGFAFPSSTAVVIPRLRHPGEERRKKMPRDKEIRWVVDHADRVSHMSLDRAATLRFFA